MAPSRVKEHPWLQTLGSLQHCFTSPKGEWLRRAGKTASATSPLPEAVPDRALLGPNPRTAPGRAGTVGAAAVGPAGNGAQGRAGPEKLRGPSRAPHRHREPRRDSGPGHAGTGQRRAAAGRSRERWTPGRSADRHPVRRCSLVHRSRRLPRARLPGPRRDSTSPRDRHRSGPGGAVSFPPAKLSARTCQRPRCGRGPTLPMAGGRSAPPVSAASAGRSRRGPRASPGGSAGLGGGGSGAERSPAEPGPARRGTAPPAAAATARGPAPAPLSRAGTGTGTGCAPSAAPPRCPSRRSGRRNGQTVFTGKISYTQPLSPLAFHPLASWKKKKKKIKKSVGRACDGPARSEGHGMVMGWTDGQSARLRAGPGILLLKG